MIPYDPPVERRPVRRLPRWSRASPWTTPGRGARLIVAGSIAFAAAWAAVAVPSDRVGPGVPAAGRNTAADPAASGVAGSGGDGVSRGLTPVVWVGVAAAARWTSAGPFSLRYSFDTVFTGPADTVAGFTLSGPILDVTGRYPLTVAAAAGGTLSVERHGTGRAIRFPNRCTAPPATCPRAILEAGRIDQLNPGPRALRFGATVRMVPHDTAQGANVVQKGFSVGGGTQYKLQVDGLAGQPSCVLAGTATIYRVIAPVDVADGRWHDLGCRRLGPVLAISVDGVPRGAMAVPIDLSIVNDFPLRIGGKGKNPDNDQFAGAIDEVYVAIDAS
jgi:hypothetical protein